MPVFKVSFERTMELVVEAESREAVDAAAMLTVEDGCIGYESMADEWIVVNIVECDEDPDIGIGMMNTFVHISDAVPPDEREGFLCEHGRDVDMLGHGCPDCETVDPS